MRYIDTRSQGMAYALLAVRRKAETEDPEVLRVVRDIIEQVRREGDAALLELGRRFDSPRLDSLTVSAEEWGAGCAAADAAVVQDLQAASANIRAFHAHQSRASWFMPSSGPFVGQMVRPLERVGLYVPGGTAAYPSSVLMCGIPANVAGVEELVICTPAGKDGEVNPLILAAARLVGASRVLKVGGAQAIAAMVFGTESVPAVDKVVGPGNIYVNAAKRLLWGQTDMDMVAGPSEVCVIADDGAVPAFVAADMLTQSEHDVHCAATLITPSEDLAAATRHEIATQLEQTSRSSILREALDRNGAIVVTADLNEAVELANACAPEHLALMVRDPLALLLRIRNAGAILLGHYTPQTLGDYYAGPSHTLPTNGTARFFSPVSVETFLKRTSILRYGQDDLKACAASLVRLAEAEGFDAHARAVRLRMEAGGGSG